MTRKKEELFNPELEKKMALQDIREKYEPFIDEINERASQMLDSYGKLKSKLHERLRSGLIDQKEYASFEMAIHQAFQNSHSIMRSAENGLSDMRYQDTQLKLKLIREEAEKISASENKSKISETERLQNVARITEEQSRMHNI